MHLFHHRKVFQVFKKKKKIKVFFVLYCILDQEIEENETESDITEIKTIHLFT